MTADTDKPFFRFFPRAYETGSLVASSAPCEVCGLPCIWRYNGVVYSAHDFENLCARCIADGGVVACDRGLQFHDVDLADVETELRAEVLQQTPGFPFFNPFVWPSTNHQPFAFWGHGEEPELWADPDVQNRMKEDWLAAYGEPLSEPTTYLLVFRSLDGSRYQCELDFD